MSEHELDLLIDELIDKIYKGNEFFLTEIAKKLKVVTELTSSEAHKLIQMLKYGGSYDEIVNNLSEYLDVDKKKIDKIFSDYAKKDLDFAKDFYAYRNIPFIEYANNIAIRRQTEAFQRIVKKEFYDFTRKNVLGYSISGLDGKTRFYGLKDVYNNLLDTAFVNVGQGKDNFNNAMSRIIKQIGSSGLKTVDYESGRSIRLDSVVRMHLKGRIRELHNEIQDIIGEEIGADGVEISVHSNPAPDHEKAQGRQFTKDNFIKLQNGETVKDYNGNQIVLKHSKSGSYRPISELNCYHSTFSIILGVNKPQYNQEQLQKIINDNNKGFEFEGSHYTNYEGTQLQRKIETAIRKQKDIRILAKESDNEPLVLNANKKIRILRSKYNQLCSASGLPSHIDRARVGRVDK